MLLRSGKSAIFLFVLMHLFQDTLGRGEEEFPNAAQCDTYLPQKRERGFWFPPLAYIRGLPLFPRNIWTFQRTRFGKNNVNITLPSIAGQCRINP
jgi:hypothetical protein